MFRQEKSCRVFKCLTDSCAAAHEFAYDFDNSSGVEFTIEEKAGPKLTPMRTWDAARTMRRIDPAKACPFVGQTLRDLRAVVSPVAAMSIKCPV